MLHSSVSVNCLFLLKSILRKPHLAFISVVFDFEIGAYVFLFTFMCICFSFVFFYVRGLSGLLLATPSGWMIIRLKKTGLLWYGKNHASFYPAYLNTRTGLEKKKKKCWGIINTITFSPLMTWVAKWKNIKFEHASACRTQTLQCLWKEHIALIISSVISFTKEGNYAQWWFKLMLCYSKTASSNS